MSDATLTLAAPPVPTQHQPLLRFLTAGSVDDGKSTLIGRMLYDANALYEDQLQAVRRDSLRRGHAGDDIDLSLVTDGLKAEREQGITIDVAFRYFSTPRRKFIIADTPGHEQYTRNMVTGASTCDLAIILIDARHGLLPQSKRHSYLASLLGIQHVVVAVNKMDLVDYREDVFDTIEADYRTFAAPLGLHHIHFIPVSALKGDNVVTASGRMPWYGGPTLLECLETVEVEGSRRGADFRFPVQMVIRPDGTFRGLAGTVASGQVRPGDEVVVRPSGRLTRDKRLVQYDGDLAQAVAGDALTITLEDNVDISRGDMLAHPDRMPRVTTEIEAMLVWMDEKALSPGGSYWLKHTTSLVPCRITGVSYRMDIHSLSPHEAPTLALNDVGRVSLSLSRPILCDAYEANRATGAFILIDRLTNATVAGGMITNRSSEGGPSSVRAVTGAMRAARLGHSPVAVWLVGNPRHAPLAYRLEQRLFEQGLMAYALEGSDHASRLADGAQLLTGAGLIAICPLYRADANGKVEVHRGDLADTPSLVVDVESLSLEHAAHQIAELLSEA